jgi:hypothetical protein
MSRGEDQAYRQEQDDLQERSEQGELTLFCCNRVCCNRGGICRALIWAEPAGLVVRYASLVPTQRPFLGAGLSGAQGNKQALCRRSIRADSLLKVPDCSHPLKHPAQLSLLAPFEDRRPNLSRELGEKVHLTQSV